MRLNDNGNGMPADKLRAVQRARLEEMLLVWLPLASDPAESQAEKAVGLALKIMERQAMLDGFDLKCSKSGEEADGPRFADPVELAKRVKAVSPVLMAACGGRLASDKWPCACSARLLYFKAGSLATASRRVSTSWCV